MSAPPVKGWCPGAHRPMMSGDGLIMRIRPRLGQLSNAQTLGLCAIAQDFGNETLDLTNRANLQLRGICQADHPKVLERLMELDLLDPDGEIEKRRNILCPPLRLPNSPSLALARALQERLHHLPDLPAKFGFAMDCDGAPQLQSAPADIRIENSPQGLLLCADGAHQGLPVTKDTAIDRLIELSLWFAQTRAKDSRRMKKHLAHSALPAHFPQIERSRPAPVLRVQHYDRCRVFGARFGKLPIPALRRLMRAHPQADLLLSPFRLFALTGQIGGTNSGFIEQADDPALRSDICTGAPACQAAAQATRDIALCLLPHLQGKSLHVSGCAKGCARARKADVVLVGKNSGFDLVLNGCSWDVPIKRNLDLPAIIDALGTL